MSFGFKLPLLLSVILLVPGCGVFVNCQADEYSFQGVDRTTCLTRPGAACTAQTLCLGNVCTAGVCACVPTVLDDNGKGTTICFANQDCCSGTCTILSGRVRGGCE